ncbi:hypothetical protein QMP26_12920 [Enterocloster clostridioformis]
MMTSTAWWSGKEGQVFPEVIPKVIDYMENKLDMGNIGLLLIFAIGIRGRLSEN